MENTNHTRLKVPEGFRHLLECLTCEILRAQPTNILKFAADYFKGRLESRQEKGYDECLLGSQIDGFYKFEPASTEHFLPSTLETTKTPGVTQIDAPSNRQPFNDRDIAASKIQAGFHGYKCRQELKEQHEAAGKIQAGYRGYACRQDIKQKHEAATKIQAGFRGYQARVENIGDKRDSTRNMERDERENGGSSLSFESKDDAVVAIQSGYRGYRARTEIARRSDAATTIQAGYRGYKVRSARRIQSQAAISIQSGYRGYHVRKVCRNQSEAALKIQTNYRGYRVRKIQSDQSEAATTIQANYRGYRARKKLMDKETTAAPKNGDLLEVVQHYDSRASFSLPTEDVKFDVNLDSDSDVDIDKVVDQMEAKTRKDGQFTDSNDNGS